jgi:type II secretory pathway pseudopilin PulG
MARSQDGFTLIEVILAMFFIAIAVIATAPLFVYAARENAAGGDLGVTGAAAEQRMELLRRTGYAALALGGDLDSDVNGYFDATDPRYVVRWEIADNPNPPVGTKLVSVRVLALGTEVGGAKEVTLVTVRGD